MLRAVGVNHRRRLMHAIIAAAPALVSTLSSDQSTPGVGSKSIPGERTKTLGFWISLKTRIRVVQPFTANSHFARSV